MLSKLLKSRHNIKHEVLNAKQHEREAEIIAHAGELGAVMIATNMAGRGTDIKLSSFTHEELIDHWKRRGTLSEGRDRGHAERRRSRPGSTGTSRRGSWGSGKSEVAGDGRRVDSPGAAAQVGTSTIAGATRTRRPRWREADLLDRAGRMRELSAAPPPTASRTSRSSAACTSSAPSATSPVASTTSCAGDPVARAISGSLAVLPVPRGRPDEDVRRTDDPEGAEPTGHEGRRRHRASDAHQVGRAGPSARSRSGTS